MTGSAIGLWLATTLLPIIVSSFITHRLATSGQAAPTVGPLGGQFLPNHPVLMNLWQALAQAAPLLAQPQNQPPLPIPAPVTPANPAQPQVDVQALLQLFFQHLQTLQQAAQQPKPPDPPKV